MAQREFVRVLLKRTIEAGVTPSALRNQGAKNVVSKAREYLTRIDYRTFVAKTQEQFIKKLDRHTKQLMLSFPAGARRNWGAARKALNLVLRDILNNQYLQKEFGFNSIGEWLEVPVDSCVAQGIHGESRDFRVRLKGIKHLTKEQNDAYQAAAKELAGKWGLEPVHLDIFLWRNSGTKPIPA